MEYLTVGTEEIRVDEFRQIKDTNLRGSIKPSGGLWFTRFNEDFPYYNDWVDYMIRQRYILFYKSKGDNPFCQPCSLVSLRDDALIYNLDSINGYNELLDKYYLNDKMFSFEKLSCDYDGIYVDISSLNRDLSRDIMNLFSSFGVNSLILFNTNAISNCRAGKVMIEPFDYEDFYVCPFYKIEVSDEKKNVRKRSLKKDVNVD